MQREQSKYTDDRTSFDKDQSLNRGAEQENETTDGLDGILDTPISRVDGQTLFENVSDSYIDPGGEDGDEDYDDEDDDLDDDDDIDEVTITETEIVEEDPDVADLDDDDLLLDDDDEDDDDDL
jgi:ribonuclease E